MSENLSALYRERAALAYALEHEPGGTFMLHEYQSVDAYLRAQEQAFVPTWPQAATPARACTHCGSRDYAPAVGQSYCVQCAMNLGRELRPGPLTDDDLTHTGEGAS